MNFLIALLITALLLGAATASLISERKTAYIALGLALLCAVIDGGAWMAGFAMALLFSPSLLVVVPLAKKAKRKRGAERAATVALATQLVSATSPAHAAGKQAAPQKQSPEQLDDAMTARLKADPVSAVLRRQVPIRFDEPARSWLGGLPQMPDDIVWPRGSTGNWPLHFAAQICCADLPESLWQGQGPREGWLLLFINGFLIGHGDQDDEGTSKAVFIDRLGPERQPPEDIQPVHDLIMSGPDYPQALTQQDVPSVWRRWPVDIVAQHQEIEGGKVMSFMERQFMPKPTTTQELYGVEPASDSPALDTDTNPPLTWQGVHDAVMVLSARQTKAATPSTQRPATNPIWEESDWVKRLIRDERGEIERMKTLREQLVQEATQKAPQTPERAGLDKRISHLAEGIKQCMPTLERLLTYDHDGGEAELAGELQANQGRLTKWWGSHSDFLKALRHEIEQSDLDSPLPSGAWEQIVQDLSSIKYGRFITQYRRGSTQPSLLWQEFTLGDHFWSRDLLREHYLSLYANSAQTQKLLSVSALQTVEDIARAVNRERPHRMGGLADPLQADIGPHDPPLLFQIASDDALNWMWGDVGAIYLSTSLNELAARRFEGEAIFECH